MDNWINGWDLGCRDDSILRRYDMLAGMDCDDQERLDEVMPLTGQAYLQSWDIYIWGEPNESSLLLRNERSG